VITIAL